MMMIPCPYCGPRAQAEFRYERAFEAVVVPGRDDEAVVERLYTRTNPRGSDEELWHHAFGCGAWLVLTRDRVSHAIEAVRTLP